MQYTTMTISTYQNEQKIYQIHKIIKEIILPIKTRATATGNTAIKIENETKFKQI